MTPGAPYDPVAELTAAIRPALDAYSAETARHRHTRTADGRPACTCGYDRSRRAQGVGQHITAAERRASKAYDEAAREIVHDLVYRRT